MSKVLPQLNLFQSTPIELSLPGGALVYPENDILDAYFQIKQKYGLAVIVFYCWKGRILITGDDCAIVASSCTISRFRVAQKYIEFDQHLAEAYRCRLNKAGYRTAIWLPVGEEISFNI